MSGHSLSPALILQWNVLCSLRVRSGRFTPSLRPGCSFLRGRSKLPRNRCNREMPCSSVTTSGVINVGPEGLTALIASVGQHDTSDLLHDLRFTRCPSGDRIRGLSMTHSKALRSSELAAAKMRHRDVYNGPASSRFRIARAAQNLHCRDERPRRALSLSTACLCADPG